jgi:hypothetical protein
MGRSGRVLVLIVVVGACKAATTSYDYPEDLDHPDYVKRSQAVRRFADLRDKEQLPGAFRLLLDDEAHIRALAHATLRAMMRGKEDFGYRPYLPEAERYSIATRWEAWWIKSREGEAEGG